MSDSPFFRFAFLSLTSVMAALAPAACSSDTSSPGVSVDAGASADAASTIDAAPTLDAAADATADAGKVVVNGCATFTDLSAANAMRTITWDFSVTSAPEHCMRIKVGQSVTWAGSFPSHPLGASGGTTPNPISSVDQTGATAVVTFTAKGTYGYKCEIHSPMAGAIEVVD